jgi:hypothetical protein
MAGAGHVARGATLRGLILMWVFAASVIGLLATMGVLPTPMLIGQDGLHVLALVVSASIAGLTYAIGLWDGTRT